MIDLRETMKVLGAKRAPERWRKFTHILNQALFEQDPLFNGGNMKQDVRSFTDLVKHSEHLWEQAVSHLRQGYHATSVFLSIACIEEVGKVSVGRFQVLINEQRSHKETEGSPRTVKGKHPLLSHTKKHQIAAFSGFLVNSRADRIVGTHNIVCLLELAERGDLERIRQNSIYSRTQRGVVHVPEACRSKEDAVFFATVAGELLCEIGGLDPPWWERLLERIAALERQFPLGHYELTLTA